MPARDWADDMALNVRHGMALADCHAEVLRVIARALRAADARGYQRAQDERMILPPADVARARLNVWPWGSDSTPIKQDDKEQA